MLERDRLLKEFDPNNKLYVIVPSPMREWMDIFRTESLQYPDMVVYISSEQLNPDPIKNYYREVEED
jgi:hypothetical protein